MLKLCMHLSRVTLFPKTPFSLFIIGQLCIFFYEVSSFGHGSPYISLLWMAWFCHSILHTICIRQSRGWNKLYCYGKVPFCSRHAFNTLACPLCPYAGVSLLKFCQVWLTTTFRCCESRTCQCNMGCECLWILRECYDTPLLLPACCVHWPSAAPCICSTNCHSIMNVITNFLQHVPAHIFLDWGLGGARILGDLKVDSMDSSLFYFIDDGFPPVHLLWKKNVGHTAVLLPPLFLIIQFELWLNE